MENEGPATQSISQTISKCLLRDLNERAGTLGELYEATDKAVDWIRSLRQYRYFGTYFNYPTTLRKVTLGGLALTIF